MGLPIAAGIIGSLLFTPYVGFQDFAMLFIAGWLVLRTQASDWQMGTLAFGFVLLELALVIQPALILVIETALLGSMAWPALYAGGGAGGVAPARSR